MTVESFASHRFHRATDANDLKSEDALEAALEEVRSGEFAAVAVTIVAINEDGEVRHYTAGNVRTVARIGMLEVVKGIFVGRMLEDFD